MACPPEDRYAETQFPTLQPPPLLVGGIRSRPDDFRVVETLSVRPEGEGEHVYLDIEKCNANTAWVAQRLAAFLGVRDPDIGYAGRKDRYALARQWFSCHLPGRPDVNWGDFAAEGVSIRGVRRHRHKLRPGQLRHNAFQIVVSHGALTGAARDRLEARLVRLRAEGFPNYFGPQRFGRGGRNLAAADRLLRLRQRVQGDRGMLISAARSWLFNQYLSGELTSGQSLAGRQGPLIGKSRDPQAGEDRLDEIERAWVRGLRRLGCRAGSRALLIVPEDLTWRREAHRLRLAFKLPPGGYATSLLRELFIPEDLSR